VSSNQPITVTVQAPTVSFTGSSTICVGSATTLSPTTGGTWVSNNPSVATVDDGGNVSTVSAGTATFTFTETLTGCSNTTGTLTVNGNSTLSLTSAPATTAQTVCIGNAIINITYLVGGGGTGATVTGLPTGVTSNYNGGSKVFTITGSPSVAGTFNYTVTTTGPCVNVSLGGSISVTANATISLTSGVGSNIQSVCANTAIADITYSIGGTGTGANVSGLPAGLGGVYDAGVFTISGSPSASGVFNYTVTTAGPCVNPNLTGTITVNALPSVTIAATPATICIGSTSTLTATNSGGNPNLVFNGSNNTSLAIPDWSATAYTYSSISLAAGANTLAATDLLQVTLNITHNNDDHLDIFLVDPSGTRAILLSSDNGGSGNNYTNTVLSTAASNVIGSGGNNTAPFTGTFRPEGTITTAPDRNGAFIGNYNSVIPANALSGAPITGSWTLRIFDDGFSTSGTLTSWALSITKPGAYSTVFNGPGSFGSIVPGGGITNTTPSVVVTPPVGVNSYTATTTDAVGCQGTTVVPVDVTVNPDATINLQSGNNNQSACFDGLTPINEIIYNIAGGGTGAGVTGLPPGVTGLYNAGIFTISGIPTALGTYNFTVSTTGSCIQAAAMGTITVNTPMLATFVRTNVSACNSTISDGTITVICNWWQR
jgi:subtilisin-like proprotein convertase family protein